MNEITYAILSLIVLLLVITGLSVLSPNSRLRRLDQRIIQLKLRRKRLVYELEQAQQDGLVMAQIEIFKRIERINHSIRLCKRRTDRLNKLRTI